MEKFKNKYRIESARLQNWDYGSAAIYFITICTKDRQHYFGEIRDGKMELNELGIIANTEWEKSPEIRPDMNLSLGEFIVMPDHFHGIIIIGKNKYNANLNFLNKFGPQSKNIASIIRGFKSSVTTYSRKNNIPFDWQNLFYDHIIRNHHEYEHISNYIINNPTNWKQNTLQINT